MAPDVQAIRARLWSTSRLEDQTRRADEVSQDGRLFSGELVRQAIAELLLDGSARDGKVAKSMLGLEWAGSDRDRLGFELTRLAEEDASRARAIAMWPHIGLLPEAVKAAVMSVAASRPSVEARFEGLSFYQTGVAIAGWSEKHVVKSPALGFHGIYPTAEEAEAVLRLRVLPHLVMGEGATPDVDGATGARPGYRGVPEPTHGTVDFYAPSLYGLTEESFLAMSRHDLETLALKLRVRYSSKTVTELRTVCLAAARALTHYVNTTGAYAEALRERVGEGAVTQPFAAKALANTHMCVYDELHQHAEPVAHLPA